MEWIIRGDPFASPWGCGGLSKGLTGAVHSQPLTASAEWRNINYRQPEGFRAKKPKKPESYLKPRQSNNRLDLIANKLLCSDGEIQQEGDSQMGRLAGKVLKINSLKLQEITASSSLELFSCTHCVSEEAGSLLASFWPFVWEIKYADAIVWVHNGGQWLSAVLWALGALWGSQECSRLAPLNLRATQGGAVAVKDCTICVFPTNILVLQICKSADGRLVLNDLAENWSGSHIALFIFQSGVTLGAVEFSSMTLLQPWSNSQFLVWKEIHTCMAGTSSHCNYIPNSWTLCVNMNEKWWF